MCEQSLCKVLVLLEFKITQTWHRLSISDGKMSKFNTSQKREQKL